MQHPYAELEEELEEADLTAHGADRDRRPHRLRDQAQDAIAHLTGLSTTDLFASVPDSGFMIGDLRRHRVGAPALGGALALAAEWQWFSGPLSRGLPARRGALVAIDGLPTVRDISRGDARHEGRRQLRHPGSRGRRSSACAVPSRRPSGCPRLAGQRCSSRVGPWTSSSRARVHAV